MKAEERLFDHVSPEVQHKVECGESLKILKKYDDQKFDLIITSPPYNIGKSYEIKTSIPLSIREKSFPSQIFALIN